MTSPPRRWSTARTAAGALSAIPMSRHVMGTTRMGDDPRTSVVDAHGRMHGLDNVVVADSSVFVTSAGYGPTLTLVALAARAAAALVGGRRRAEPTARPCTGSAQEMGRRGAFRWPRTPRRGPRRACPGSRACACRHCPNASNSVEGLVRGKSSSCHCTRKSSGQRHRGGVGDEADLGRPGDPHEARGRPRRRAAAAATTGRPKIVPMDRPQ